jgi:triphosphoribosyl-dephospho-CoA synthase
VAVDPVLARHALVAIRRARRAAVRPVDPAHVGDVEAWLARDLPAVVRRRDPAMPSDQIALAIALPLARGRARVALSAPADAVLRVLPPVPLARALASAPRAWVSALERLVREASRAGIVLRAYGSLAWQHLTGEPYVREGSDVDLVAPGATSGERARSLALLRRWEPHASPRLDGELALGGGRAVAWREALGNPARVLVKSLDGVGLEEWVPPRLVAAPRPTRAAQPAEAIERAALAALADELAAEPKPGLVSPSTRGAHRDMDARTLEASLRALRGFFAEVAEAGRAGAAFETLRALGVAAEQRMLDATAGVNTHRGAIFALGLLSAAAGRVSAEGRRLSAEALADAVRTRWGSAIRRLAPRHGSHGDRARRAHGVPGAREEAAAGFPHVLAVGLPALRASLRRGATRNDATVQCLFALMSRLPDTNVLHRGGPDGLALARRAAEAFLDAGGVHRPGWRAHAREIDRALVARNLSPGGSADLLAATLFVHRIRALDVRPLSPRRPAERSEECGGHPARERPQEAETLP